MGFGGFLEGGAVSGWRRETRVSRGKRGRGGGGGRSRLGEEAKAAAAGRGRGVCEGVGAGERGWDERQVAAKCKPAGGV